MCGFFSKIGKTKTSAFINNRGPKYVYLLGRNIMKELREKGSLSLIPRTGGQKPANIDSAKGLIVYKNQSMATYDKFPASVFKVMKDNEKMLGEEATKTSEPATKTSKAAAAKEKIMSKLKTFWDEAVKNCKPSDTDITD